MDDQLPATVLAPQRRNLLQCVDASVGELINMINAMNSTLEELRIATESNKTLILRLFTDINAPPSIKARRSAIATQK